MCRGSVQAQQGEEGRSRRGWCKKCQEMSWTIPWPLKEPLACREDIGLRRQSWGGGVDTSLNFYITIQLTTRIHIVWGGIMLLHEEGRMRTLTLVTSKLKSCPHFLTVWGSSDTPTSLPDVSAPF